MKTILRNKSFKPVLAIVVAGLLLAAAIVLWKRPPGPDLPAPAPAQAHTYAHAEEGLVRLSAQQVRQAGITTATAGPATIAAPLQLPGEVRLDEDRTAHIVPRVPGVAESVAANLGQAVRKGQVLAVIASPELAELRGALSAARTRLDLARVTHERERKLWQDGISAEQDYLKARQAWREAEIAVHSARAKLAALGVSPVIAPGIAPAAGALPQYALRAPFDGVIVEKHISLGEAVRTDANVFVLSDLSRLLVDVSVAPKDLDAVRVGEAADVRAAATALAATGKVTYVGALVGEQTRAATARVALANPSRAWRPGLFVNVTLAGGEKRAAVAVLREAVQTVDGRPVVFVQAADGFRAQPVVVGATDGRHAEILQGLSPGVTYAGGGGFVLKAEQGKDGASHAD